MTTILALDLGQSTGFALGTDDGANDMTGVCSLMQRGSWNLKPDKFSGGGMRFVKFLERLDHLMKAMPFDRVVFEGVRRHKGVDAAHAFGGYMATLQSWCERQDPPVPYEGVPVGTIKKFATNHGNASKPEMMAAVAAMGFPCDTDDEADAVALLLMKLQELT